MADSGACLYESLDHNVQDFSNDTQKQTMDIKPHKNLCEILEISVTEAEKRHSNGTLNIKDAFITYLIETRVIDTEWKGATNNICTLWRRYREFEMLKNYLEVTYPFVVVPPLPEKKVSFAWQKLATDEFDPDFIDRRRAGLETFLLRIALHPVLSVDKIFFGFLQQENNWKDSVCATGYMNKVESRLKILSTIFRLKKADKYYEEIKNYSSDLHNNISNLLKMRAKLADRRYGIHKIHRNYGRVFSEWSALEKQMGDGLQSAGHYMDHYAAMIDELLDEEEQFADQLKEYLLYAESLKFVCRKQEMLQCNIEQADENLALKSQQRDNLLQGKTGFVTRLLGTIDSEELREAKMQQLDRQIQEAEVQIRLATEEANKFIEKSTMEIKEFEKQKANDIRKSLLMYAHHQMRMCKKAILVWTSLRECFQNI